MTTGEEQTVQRRRVFYIPGYDPFPARRYREIYRKEALYQANISGYELSLGPRQEDRPFGWTTEWREGDQVSRAEIEILEWSDIVKNSMRAGILATYGQLLATSWRYIASGALFRLMRLRKGPVIAALYPVGILLLQLVVAMVVARVAGALLAQAGLPFGEWIGLLAIWPVLALFREWDNRLFAYYLMHDFAFSAHLNGAYTPELQQRLADFRARISSALEDSPDEVLVVGHSSGAYLGVSVLASLHRTQDDSALSFLSLGQVVPMVSFLPEATELRRDLQALSEREDIFWLDVSAPGDGCSFALCDPVSVTGVATSKKSGPLVVSAAFTQTLSPKRWKALRWRFFRLHFQYLCAFDSPERFDYFRITAGPQTLAQRFSGRAPSSSRVETPLSGYRDVA